MRQGPGDPTVGMTRLAIAAAAVLIAQQTAGKATRDALFLLAHGVDGLPRVMMLAAVGARAVVPLLTRYMVLLGPRTIVPGLLTLSVLGFAGEYVLAGLAPKTAASLVFLHQSVVGSILISGFWSLLSEKFDVRTMRGIAPKIAAGATAGGLAGGLVAERLSTLLPPIAMLPVLAGFHAVAVVLVTPLRPAAREREALEEPSTAEVLRESPYLRHIGALLLLVTIAVGFIDFAFKEAAAQRFEGGDLLRFFALFYMISSAATLLVQAGVTRWWPSSLGPAYAVAAMPLALGLGALGILFVPGLVSRTLAVGLMRVMQSSVFRTGYETLYVPVSLSERRAAKTANDVWFDRLGDLAAGSAVHFVRSVPWLPASTVLVGLVLLASGAAAWLARKLGREYVQSLEHQVVDLAVGTSSDALASDRALATVYAGADFVGELAPAGASSLESERSATVNKDEAVVQRIRTLCSGQAAEIREVLARTLSAAEAAHAMDLLAREDLHRDVLSALERCGVAISGQLVDAMLDLRQPPRVRRRIPRVLATVVNERTLLGLAEGLRDPLFDVRIQCAHAMAKIHTQAEHLPIPTAHVLAALASVIAVLPVKVPGQEAVPPRVRVMDSVRATVSTPPHEDRRIEYVFVLLSLVLPTDAVHSAYTGLRGRDLKDRAIALEYLENVLPPGLRTLIERV